MFVYLLFRDTDVDQSYTWQAINDLDLQSVATKDDVAIIRYLCSALSIRVAQIVSACKWLMTLYLFFKLNI